MIENYSSDVSDCVPRTLYLIKNGRYLPQITIPNLRKQETSRKFAVVVHTLVKSIYYTRQGELSSQLLNSLFRYEFKGQVFPFSYT